MKIEMPSADKLVLRESGAMSSTVVSVFALLIGLFMIYMALDATLQIRVTGGARGNAGMGTRFFLFAVAAIAIWFALFMGRQRRAVLIDRSRKQVIEELGLIALTRQKVHRLQLLTSVTWTRSSANSPDGTPQTMHRIELRGPRLILYVTSTGLEEEAKAVAEAISEHCGLPIAAGS